MLKVYKSFTLIGLVVGSSLLTSCYDMNKKADPENLRRDDPGVEYAPQMYHSEPYDPMAQIKDKGAGLQYWPWDSVGTDEKHGEWYNSNYYNPHGMNMRVPAPNTIERGVEVYTIAKDSLDLADAQPDKTIESEGYNAEECQQLYVRYCSHCHGKELDGKGPVEARGFKGIANLKGGAVKAKTESYIFHVITHGKGKMRSHAAQVSAEDRWKIAAYVKSTHKE